MPGRRRKQKPAFRKRKNENRLGIIMATLTISMVVLAVGYNSYTLLEKQAQYKAREAELATQIQEQKDRAKELNDFASYTKTKKYVEEVAKDKLGLVYEDEIIFKKEDK